ncbi:hypothetical protein [Acaryochloris marina]|uniref:hypothetical protein n=1 Tax=Acaryochloris marina TaxID=155978 RepID=UPI001BAE58DB|nr:hypothetical protein [Acaryochloris marina]QUY46141.1 hypothetical protein I1H34_30910 [Acaryochloris marina S15]
MNQSQKYLFLFFTGITYPFFVNYGTGAILDLLLADQAKEPEVIFFLCIVLIYCLSIFFVNASFIKLNSFILGISEMMGMILLYLVAFSVSASQSNLSLLEVIGYAFADLAAVLVMLFTIFIPVVLGVIIHIRQWFANA